MAFIVLTLVLILIAACPREEDGPQILGTSTEFLDEEQTVPRCYEGEVCRRCDPKMYTLQGEFMDTPQRIADCSKAQFPYRRADGHNVLDGCGPDGCPPCSCVDCTLDRGWDDRKERAA